MTFIPHTLMAFIPHTADRELPLTLPSPLQANPHLYEPEAEILAAYAATLEEKGRSPLGATSEEKGRSPLGATSEEKGRSPLGATSEEKGKPMQPPSVEQERQSIHATGSHSAEQERKSPQESSGLNSYLSQL
jgi:hypothetical protein